MWEQWFNKIYPQTNHFGLHISYKIILFQLGKEQYKNYSISHVKDLTTLISSLLQLL
jgi:hypothetical protein